MHPLPRQRPVGEDDGVHDPGRRRRARGVSPVRIESENRGDLVDGRMVRRENWSVYGELVAPPAER